MSFLSSYRPLLVLPFLAVLPAACAVDAADDKEGETSLNLEGATILAHDNFLMRHGAVSKSDLRVSADGEAALRQAWGSIDCPPDSNIYSLNYLSSNDKVSTQRYLDTVKIVRETIESKCDYTKVYVDPIRVGNVTSLTDAEYDRISKNLLQSTPGSNRVFILGAGTIGKLAGDRSNKLAPLTNLIRARASFDKCTKNYRGDNVGAEYMYNSIFRYRLDKTPQCQEVLPILYSPESQEFCDSYSSDTRPAYFGAIKPCHRASEASCRPPLPQYDATLQQCRGTEPNDCRGFHPVFVGSDQYCSPRELSTRCTGTTPILDRGRCRSKKVSLLDIKYTNTRFPHGIFFDIYGTIPFDGSRCPATWKVSASDSRVCTVRLVNSLGKVESIPDTWSTEMAYGKKFNESQACPTGWEQGPSQNLCMVDITLDPPEEVGLLDIKYTNTRFPHGVFFDVSGTIPHGKVNCPATWKVSASDSRMCTVRLVNSLGKVESIPDTWNKKVAYGKKFNESQACPTGWEQDPNRSLCVKSIMYVDR